MTDPIDYDFAVVTVVPHVHLYGAAAVGVILHARTAEFIDAEVLTDPDALRHRVGLEHCPRLARYLASWQRIARGEAEAGRLGLLPPSERFHWLTAPRSDMIQCSPVHAGRTDDPARTLRDLFQDYVRP
ncbi:MAG: DUF3037 domain-containing protein [Gemmatimonadota bacterium]